MCSAVRQPAASGAGEEIDQAKHRGECAGAGQAGVKFVIQVLSKYCRQDGGRSAGRGQTERNWRCSPYGGAQQ